MTHRDRKHGRQDNLIPERDNQAAAGAPPAGDPSEAPKQSTAGEDRDTGAGTGGATESDGRPGQHEGVHLGNQPNS